MRNPLTTLAGIGVGAAAVGAGAVTAVTSRRHAIAPETGETYAPVPSTSHVVLADDGALRLVAAPGA